MGQTKRRYKVFVKWDHDGLDKLPVPQGRFASAWNALDRALINCGPDSQGFIVDERTGKDVTAVLLKQYPEFRIKMAERRLSG